MTPSSSSPRSLPSPRTNNTSARRRKGIPSKAPTRSPTKQQNGTNQSSPKVIKASLLLLALLREARRTNTAISNQRFTSSSPTSNKPVQRKREREILPPALPGYGRGQRSASASLSEATAHRYANGTSGREASPGGELGHGEPSTSATTSRKLKPPPSLSLLNGAGGSRLKRSSSIEPLPDNQHLMVNSASRTMSRAVSAGPGGHHHSHHDYAAPVHSPLARSFSFDGKRERSASAQGTRSVLREASSRKVDAPHHLHEYDMTYIPA